MASETTLLGAAGEHYVMSQLLRRGFIAALAPVGVPNCDIVVTDDLGDRLCAIQVKTRRNIGSDGGWHMREKHEGLRSPTLFYAFVDFGRAPTDAASVYVVPAPIVANAISTSHQAWLAAPGSKGQSRNDSAFRRFLPDYSHLGLTQYGVDWLERYRGNDGWTLLNHAT